MDWGDVIVVAGESEGVRDRLSVLTFSDVLFSRPKEMLLQEIS